MKPRVLLPLALGTNRDSDLALAFELAGAEPVIVPLTALRAGEVSMNDFQMLAVPGGFSYGDALGAGRLLGLDLAGWFGDQLHEAAAAGKPIFGVCNGFQALVRAGLLPGGERSDDKAVRSGEPSQSSSEAQSSSKAQSSDTAQSSNTVLTENASGRFECRWVTMAAPSSRSVWTSGLTESIRCPVAHGEGRFVSEDLAGLEENNQIALRYVSIDGSPAQGDYPTNPNGSDGDIAGICDETGLVLGLMPHPENHVLTRQDPLRGRKLPTGSGPTSGGDSVSGGRGLCLPLFVSGVAAVAG